MKRSGVALVVASLAIIAVAPAADAATTWTARFTGHGAATIRVGSPDRLSIGLTSYRAGTTWTVALRRGSCRSLGTLILATRIKAGSTGRLTRTVTLTTAQTRAAKLPLTLRVGTKCSSFTAPVVVPVVPGTTFGAGIFKVGLGGIQPGTYRTAGTAGCYWARLSVFGGTDVLSNGAGNGPEVVTIFQSDGAFKSSACGTWVLNARAAPTATPGDGVWRVGIDIQPGTYRSAGGDACSWARLYGFAGNSQTEIHLGAGPTIVTILATDVGFESRKCGTWILAS